MTLIGLVRVTGEARDAERQHEVLDPICARIFEEESSRRRRIESRPQLLAALESLRTGDRLLVRRVRDLAQSMVDGWEVLIDLIEHGVAVRIVEGSDASDYDELTDIRGLARDITAFRRSALSDRFKRGLHEARKGGAVGGRPRVADRAMRAAIFNQRDQGKTLRSIAQSLGVSVGTVHNVLKAEKLSEASS